MPIVCNYYTKCDLPQKSKASVKVNGVEICYDAWNKATEEARGWFKKATDMYNRGLITKKELSSKLQDICYHHVDPSYPVPFERPMVDHSKKIRYSQPSYSEHVPLDPKGHPTQNEEHIRKGRYD